MVLGGGFGVQVESAEWVRWHRVDLFVSATGHATEQYRYPRGSRSLNVAVTHFGSRGYAFEAACAEIEEVLFGGGVVVPPLADQGTLTPSAWQEEGAAPALQICFLKHV
jgi:hypothetical protein